MAVNHLTHQERNTMENASYNFREVRIVYEDELTHCYVFLEPLGDCPIGVQGWHYKAFPISRPGIEIFGEDVVDAIRWPLEAPRAWGEHN